MSGLFITLEGGEGAGKSSLIAAIREFLSNRIDSNVPIAFTREPGSSTIGQHIREMILSIGDSSFDLNPKAEALLFAADRAQHMAEIITPILDKNGIVVCDRFIDSSYAYQSVARNLGPFIEDLSLWAISDRKPDLTILVDIDPIVGLERKQNQKEFNKMEKESLQFHYTVRDAFLELAASDEERFFLVDGMQSPERVANLVISKIDSELTTKGF